MEKKILVIASTFPRWKGDTTPGFVYKLSERLAFDYKITVLAPHHRKAAKREVMGGLDVRRFAYFKPESLQKLCYGGGMIPNMKKSFLARIQMPLLIISEFFASYNIIRKEQINMLHAHWILPQGFVSVFLKKRFKIPLLVTVHGSDLFPLKNKLFIKLQNFVLKNADYVTVNSKATRNELTKRFPYYSSKIKIIPMGVDTTLFKKRRAKKPKKYSKNKILLSVGRLSDQKGLQYLIDAMLNIIKAEPKAKLLVIGEGPYEKILREKVRSNNILGNVEFLGAMHSSDISKYYNFADIFVLPSLSTKTGTEALGLSLLEAMSSGCAVIGTNVGGIPFVIKGGYNGILVRQNNKLELSNSITSLLKDQEKSQKLGNNAAKSVRKDYSWEKISKDFIKLYEGILK
jgi:glycosyltransferase involved in cell wall biosynthesis